MVQSKPDTLVVDMKVLALVLGSDSPSLNENAQAKALVVIDRYSSQAASQLQLSAAVVAAAAHTLHMDS